MSSGDFSQNSMQGVLQRDDTNGLCATYRLAKVPDEAFIEVQSTSNSGFVSCNFKVSPTVLNPIALSRSFVNVDCQISTLFLISQVKS